MWRGRKLLRGVARRGAGQVALGHAKYVVSRKNVRRPHYGDTASWLGFIRYLTRHSFTLSLHESSLWIACPCRMWRQILYCVCVCVCILSSGEDCRISPKRSNCVARGVEKLSLCARPHVISHLGRYLESAFQIDFK